MNIQALGEIASVCLLAMKLREESWDKDAKYYKLSLRQAAEEAVAEDLREHPPEVQKTMAGLIYLMVTSWNDAEMWATSIVALGVNSAKETFHEYGKPVQSDGSNSLLSTEGNESPSAAQSVPETNP